MYTYMHSMSESAGQGNTWREESIYHNQDRKSNISGPTHYKITAHYPGKRGDILYNIWQPFKGQLLCRFPHPRTVVNYGSFAFGIGPFHKTGINDDCSEEIY